MKQKMSPRLTKPKSRFWENIELPIAVAHRGGDLAGSTKENSLKAFEAAYKAGFRWFETDVVPSKDGVLLAMHGRGYQRHPNKDLPSRLKLQGMTYKQIKARIKVGGENIVTLDELLDTFPAVKFFIDPKTLKAASALAEFIEKRPQDIERICIGSFIPFNNSRIYKSIKCATGQAVGLSLLGPLKAQPLRWAAFLTALKPLVKIYVDWTKAGSVIVPQSWIIKKRGEKLIGLSHEFNLKVGVYTPNSARDIHVCLKKGTDVIISDNLIDLGKATSGK